jgi:branched-chain amino acid transport system substrate-binding protein
LFKVVTRTDGKYQTETVRKVLSGEIDAYATKCKMPDL